MSVTATKLVVEGYELPLDRYYDPESDFWIRADDDEWVIGMDSLGQETAGDFAFVSLLPVGTEIRRGEPFGSVEAGKFVGPLVAPASGVITRVNAGVLESPRTVNRDPYGEGWLVAIRPVLADRERAGWLVGAEAVARHFQEKVRACRLEGALAE